MIRQTSYTLLLVVMFFLASRAELINGPANIRVKPDKAVFLSLYDHVDVDCTAPTNGWFQISVSVKISKLQYEKQLPLKKGDKITDLKGKLIGEVLSDIPPESSYTFTYGGAPGVPEVFGISIFGYTHQSNIRENSIIENPLRSILQDKTTGLTMEHFKEFIKEFSFRKEGLLKEIYPGLTEYMVYENAIDDISPIDRVRLIFDGKTLIAIIHGRDLHVQGAEDIPLVRGLKLMLFKTPAGINKEAFVQKNKDSYEGVD